MVNRRRKGKEGELDIIKRLREWWGGEWSRNRIGTAGDDLATPKDFPCSIEVKNQKGVVVQHCFQPTAALMSWWGQCKDQASAVGKPPMLCMKLERNWYAAFVMREYLALGWELPASYLVSQWTSDDLVVVMRVSQLAIFNPRATNE